jgi:ADP-heptose:LPS heptosyltransferase
MPAIQQKKRVVTGLVRRERPEKIQRVLSLKDFYEKRNKILVFRNTGGLGDIFMHRMMFEDFHRIMPDVEVHFACPPQYHPAVIDHPYIAKVVNSFEVQRQDYIVYYNTTTACGRYEMGMAPYSGKHRADIWSDQCGVILSNHNMHIHLTNEEKKKGKDLIEQHRDRQGPAVCIAPISAMENKNLLPHQLMGVVEGLRERGYYAFGLHNHPLYTLIKNKVPSISGTSIREWMGILNQTDYVVSVDTAAFHCAGGIGKPLVGIFTFVNAETYAKYYPNTELIQGVCPDGHAGCYNWGICPYKKQPQLPCRSSIESDNILASFDKLAKRFPV